MRTKAQACRSKLGRTSVDLGPAGWMPGGSERMNGKGKELSDRNTFFTCDADERGSGLEENLRLSSLKFAYSRLSSLNGRKIVGAPRLISRAAALGLRLAGRRRAGSDRGLSQKLAMCGRESLNGEQFGVWVPSARRRRVRPRRSRSPFPWLRMQAVNASGHHPHVN